MSRPIDIYNQKEKVISELDNMLKELKADQKQFDETPKSKTPIYKILYYKQLFSKRPYTSKKFKQWAKKFAKVGKILAKMEKILEELEARVAYCMVRGKGSPPGAIFFLKHNFKWKDVVETKGEIKHEHKYTNLPPEPKTMKDWEDQAKRIEKKAAAEAAARKKAEKKCQK